MYGAKAFMVLTAGAYVNDQNIGFFLRLTVIQFLCSFEKKKWRLNSFCINFHCCKTHF